MTKESFKKFVKDYKGLIVGGAMVAASVTALAVIGVKLSKPSLVKATDSVDPYFLDMLTAVDKAGKDCSSYAVVTLSDLNAAIGNDGVIERLCRLTNPDGTALDVKNLIVFGNEVEP